MSSSSPSPPGSFFVVAIGDAPPPPEGDTTGDSSKSKSKSQEQPSDQSNQLPSDSESNGHVQLLSGSSFDHSSRIIGAAVGSILVLAMIVLAVFLVARKKRKHRKVKYYGDETRENPNAFYANMKGQNGNQPPQNWNNNAGSVAGSSNYGWPAPPPPTMTSDAGMSSGGYSSSSALPPLHPGVVLGSSQSVFSYEALAAATNEFAQSNMLGQGGFGYVYKGVLPNGKEVAVKTLKANSGQGEREFQAEVDIISRVHHRHLVSLVGYCTAGSQRMLVYECVPNGTLEYHLHGADCPPLEWSTRLKIALGAAKGFAYLHEDCNPRIIHRDIKGSNILLDLNFEAKVSDFGLAKLSQDTNTHVSTRIMGTFGYLAPEYASTGKLTEKSDVYSFGIVLMELITGRRPIDLCREDEDSLVDWAMPILERAMEGGNYDELVDPRLVKNYDEQEMYGMVCCAAACIRQSAKKRPKMSQVVRVLEGGVSLDDLTTKQGTALLGSRSNSDFDFRPHGKGNGEFSSSSSSSNELSGSNNSSSEHTLQHQK